MNNTKERAVHALEYLQGLMSRGYILRSQQVNGDYFIFATHFADRPQLAGKAKTLIECAEQMESDEQQGKEVV